MIIHTNKGEIELGKCTGGLESLPELCFECEILSPKLQDEIKNIISQEKKRQFKENKAFFKELGYGSIEELEADNAVNEYSYIILFLKKDSDKIVALYEKGGTDKSEHLDYCASIKLELNDSKRKLKELILSALEQYYFQIYIKIILKCFLQVDFFN